MSIITHKQRGYALLSTATLIMLGISISALVVTKSLFFVQKEQSNEYQQQMAFQAAEAGLEYGIGYLYENSNAILKDTNNDGFIDVYTNANTSNVQLSNGADYSITYTNTTSGNYRTIEIASTGHASAGESQRTIRQLVTIFPLVVNSPPAGVIAKNSVDFSGNMTITNTETGRTIWSGGGTSLGGSASTATSGGTASTRTSLGADVVQNDANLSGLSNDQFFNLFFGQTKAAAQASSTMVFNNNGNTNLSSDVDGVLGQSIWINQTAGEARINSNVTIGSPDHPVILIVNGPLSINGNATIYGMVYVIGDWINHGGGNLEVHGGMVVEGNLQSTGTPNVIFSQSTLGNLNQIGVYTKVPGSWRDF